MNQHVIESLIQSACPSIAYRIKKEILNEDVNSPDMMALQESILRDPEVTRILSLQGEDGWLGGTFHGRDEPESGIRFLMEKGVKSSHPAVQRALDAIEHRGEAFDRGCMERVGKPLDAWRLGGSKLMRACVFAYAKREEHPFVREGVREALDVFGYVCNTACIEDIYEPYKGINVFRPGVMWPCVYHLRLLAHTVGWRTRENQAMLSRAVARLAELSPIPEIKLLHRHQVISPASIYMNDFNCDMAAMDDRAWMMWFHRTELIASAGACNKAGAVFAQIAYVRDTCLENGMFTKKLRHAFFTKWSQYTGLALEADWKAEERRVNDLTFRWLMINARL